MFSLKDILIPNFVQNVFYTYDDNKNKEFLKIEILPETFDEIEYKMLTEKEIYSLYLNYFDLDKNIECNDFEGLIQSLLLEHSEINDLDDYIYETDIDKNLFDINNDIEIWINDYLEKYKIIVDRYPIFYLFYPRIWKILRYIACTNNLYDGKYKVDLDSAIDEYVELYNEIHYLAKYKGTMRQEILDIFEIPSKHTIKLPTSEIALIYQAYKSENGTDSCFNNLNPFIRNINNHLYSDWNDIVSKLPKKLNAPLEFPECNTVTKFLRQVTELLIHNECSIRKCKHCKRYFVTRYSSLAEYCERLVEGTKSNCQEYHSKKRYKNKKAKDPLYQTYIKYYNRIYGRIRRKSLPEDSPLLDKIKTLYSNYDDRFKLAETDDIRHEILDEFIVEAEKLIKG